MTLSPILPLMKMIPLMSVIHVVLQVVNSDLRCFVILTDTSIPDLDSISIFSLAKTIVLMSAMMVVLLVVCSNLRCIVHIEQPSWH